MQNTNTVLINTKANPPFGKPVKYQDENGIHHYALIQKIGFPTGYKCCWCGATLEFAVKEPWRSIDSKRRAFFDQHDGCQPMEN